MPRLILAVQSVQLIVWKTESILQWTEEFTAGIIAKNKVKLVSLFVIKFYGYTKVNAFPYWQTVNQQEKHVTKVQEEFRQNIRELSTPFSVILEKVHEDELLRGKHINIIV